MYMANVRPNARGPNATYIPLAHVGDRVGSIYPKVLDPCRRDLGKPSEFMVHFHIFSAF